MSLQLSIIVMVFNERKGLEREFHSLSAALRVQKISHEIIIIDDGSTDGSDIVADSLAATKQNVKVIHHKSNLGLGEVYRSGFRAAKGEYLSFFPADGQVNPESIITFFKKRADADLILGFVNKRQDGWRAYFLSKAERLFYTILFGHFPKFQGPFLLKTSVLRALPLRSTGRGWGVVMELILRAYREGLIIRHSAILLRRRNFGSSKVNKLGVIISSLSQAVRIRIMLQKKTTRHAAFIS